MEWSKLKCNLWVAFFADASMVIKLLALKKTLQSCLIWCILYYTNTKLPSLNDFSIGPGLYLSLLCNNIFTQCSWAVSAASFFLLFGGYSTVEDLSTNGTQIYYGSNIPLIFIKRYAPLNNDVIRVQRMSLKMWILKIDFCMLNSMRNQRACSKEAKMAISFKTT